ncbi:MAG: hypothetical protein MJ232_08905 [archaeon]|nr:hypothetical protein [archaeon]
MVYGYLRNGFPAIIILKMDYSLTSLTRIVRIVACINLALIIAKLVELIAYFH